MKNVKPILNRHNKKVLCKKKTIRKTKTEIYATAEAKIHAR